MADMDTQPLTDEERAELEALRAEKARRERAELEALRAERREGVAAASPDPAREPAPSSKKPAVDPVVSSAQKVPTSEAPAAPAASRPRPAAPEPRSAAPGERTFGERMVLSDSEDEDGIPSMPPAQKIIIAVCLIGVTCFALYMAGVIG